MVEDPFASIKSLSNDMRTCTNGGDVEHFGDLRIQSDDKNIF
jgi:hypothetical protein